MEWGHSISIETFVHDRDQFIEKLNEWKYNIFQIYITNNRSFSFCSYSKSDLQRIKKFCDQQNIKIVVHGKLIYNFANPKCTERKKGISQIEVLVHELEYADILGAPVVIHQGKNVTKLDHQDALNLYVSNIEKVLRLSKTQNQILLENAAGQGTEIGTNLEDLSYIYHRIDPSLRHRIGFCYDTCHGFAAGEIDGTNLDFDHLFFKFDSLIGLENLKLIHLNDSQKEYCCRVDRHENILYGHLFTRIEIIKEFIVWVRKLKIPFVLETPGTHFLEDLLLLRELTNKKK